MNVIVFNSSPGVSVVSPADGVEVETLVKTCVPKGAEFKIVDDSLLPKEPQYSWRWNGGNISVDVSAINEKLRDRLIYEANQYISYNHWQSKLAMNRLSDVERHEFNLWLDYLDALEAIDTSSATDIKWPTAPVEQAN